MLKNVFHNNKSSLNNLEVKTFYKADYPKKILNVDVNKLLNRVKINEKNEKKQKIIFFSSGILFDRSSN